MKYFHEITCNWVIFWCPKFGRFERLIFILERKTSFFFKVNKENGIYYTQSKVRYKKEVRKTVVKYWFWMHGMMSFLFGFLMWNWYCFKFLCIIKEIHTHIHMVNMYIKHLGCKITHNIILRSSTFQQYGIQPANLNPTHSLDSWDSIV